MLLNIILIVVVVSIFLNMYFNYKESYTNTDLNNYLINYFDNISLVSPSCDNTNYTKDNCKLSTFKSDNINNIRKIVDNNTILNTSSTIAANLF